MRRSTIIRDTRSVLNTDSFDIRRFQEVYQLSEELQRVREESTIPAIESLLRDIWASMYKMKPTVRKKKIPETLRINRTFLNELMNHKKFEKYRTYTKLDDLTSVIYTAIVGETLNNWLAEMVAADEDGTRQLEAIQTLQNEWQMGESQQDTENEEATEELNEDVAELDEKLRVSLDKDRERFASRIEEAMEDAIIVKGGIVSLIGGTSTGKGDADLEKVPLREKLALANTLMNDPEMKSIAEWAGRFKEIANDKERKEYIEAPERRGVIRGDDLDRLLPAEYSLYTHPVAKHEFLRRYAEKETMQYDQKKRSDTGKGPIVFCLDQSGSMSELDNQAKGFVLALGSIAKKQNRDLCVILFSTTVQRFVYKKGHMTAVELARMAQTFVGGGTDYTVALEEALRVIDDSSFSNADLIFVTDGADELSEPFVKKFIERKKAKDFNILSLVIGADTATPELFSDRVVHVTDFDEEGSYTAFEI